MFPILRDKFLTYEDYINTQKEYKKIIEYDKHIEDQNISNLSIKKYENKF